jgi:hypothetical protein
MRAGGVEGLKKALAEIGMISASAGFHAAGWVGFSQLSGPQIPMG